ncbi:MAG: hypothetical protein WCW14_01060 [Candidatus Paceibacterota bacterium]
MIIPVTFDLETSIPVIEARFLAPGWKATPSDERTQEIKMIDTEKLVFTTLLQPGDKKVTGKERAARLKSHQGIPLGHAAFLTLISQNGWLPEKMREELVTPGEGAKETRVPKVVQFNDAKFIAGSGETLCMCLFFSSRGTCDWKYAREVLDAGPDRFSVLQMVA